MCKLTYYNITSDGIFFQRKQAQGLVQRCYIACSNCLPVAAIVTPLHALHAFIRSLAAAHTPTKKVIHVSLSLGFDRFQLFLIFILYRLGQEVPRFIRRSCWWKVDTMIVIMPSFGLDIIQVIWSFFLSILCSEKCDLLCYLKHSVFACG